MYSRIKIALPFLIRMLLIVSAVSSCRNEPGNNMLLVTRSANPTGNADYETGKEWRYLAKAQIVFVNGDKPGPVEVLTGDFHSACHPDVSGDGKTMLFAARKKENDPWQIWEMNLKSRKYRKILALGDDCTDPAYLPTGRIVFSRKLSNDTVKTAHILFSCNADGTQLRQITFHPHADFATSVLNDGRLLTLTKQILPVPAEQMYAVMRPDGTKADLFCRGEAGSSLLGKAREGIDGLVWFVEADSTHQTKLISVSYNRPLHTRVNHSGELTGEVFSVCPVPGGSLYLSYSPTPGEPYGIYPFDPVNRSMGPAIYTEEGFQALETVLVHTKERPKKLPSEVDMEVKTGQIMCQNINLVDDSWVTYGTELRRGTKIEVMGVDSSLGIVEVEPDGSFYLKVAADTPFRILVLGEDGTSLRNSCAWLWLRPNERRGCIGCHEDHELVPENTVPLAVKKMPVTMPVSLTQMDDKEVELE